MKSRPSVIFWTDEKDELGSVEEALAVHGSGVRMITASESEHVLDRLRHGEVSPDFYARRRPAVVFIDFDAIGSSALDVVREMKADPVLRRIPVLAYGDDPGDDTVAAVYESGVNAFIKRSRSFSDFSDVVTGALDFWLGTVKLAPEPFLPVSRTPRTPTREPVGFTYRIFPQLELGVAIKSGVLHGKPLLNYIETFLGDPDWRAGFSILDDYRSVTRVDITSAEAREISTVLEARKSHLEGGKTGVVVNAWMHQIVGELLISMGRLDRDRVRIFRSLTDALDWLQIPAQAVRSVLPR